MPKKKKSLSKQTQREFEISKMEYQYYRENRACYEREYYKKGDLIDIFIFIFSICSVFMTFIFNETLYIDILQFFSICTIINIVVCIYFNSLSFRWVMDKTDKKEKWKTAKYQNFVVSMNYSTLFMFFVQCICILSFF